MTAKDYMNLPHSIVVKHIIDETGDYYFATVSEFDGCMSHGDTWEEAHTNIMDAMELWIEGCIENVQEVPAPLYHY